MIDKKTPLAWYNLVHYKVRTAAAVAGVLFAVVLIFMQLGFRSMAEKTASIVYDSLEFDILLRSKGTSRLAQSRPIPRLRLYQAASLAGVRGVSSFSLSYNRWQSASGAVRPMLVFGVPLGEPVFFLPELREKIGLLTAPEFLLIDRATRAEFGPRNGREFGDQDIGTEAEFERHRVRIVGNFLLGTTFDSDGIAVMNDAGFRRIQPAWPSGFMSFGLIRLENGADAKAIADQMRRRFVADRTDDVDVFTRDEIIARERFVWLWQMSIGLIFTMGVAVAFLVGSVIVYQVLSSDVTNHLPEYATLKAMGYTNAYLSRVVLGQAAILGFLGFLPGLAVSQLLYYATVWQTRLPLSMTTGRIVGVLALSLGMCILSGAVAMRRLRSADPADLF